MKIGLITFHWGTNYGAVLQSFALQHFLKCNRYDVDIINYIPLRVRLLQCINHFLHFNLKWFIKEFKIKDFRKDYLTVSKKIFFTNKKLRNNCDDYDIYICGSDQIWNESFVNYAEHQPTLSYYLNFVKNDRARISYAASFGTNKLSTKVKDLIKPELEIFSDISVRENSGKKIIKDLGLKSTVVVDPTLLLKKDSYEKILTNTSINNHYQLFSYILHENQSNIIEIKDYIFENYFDKSIDKKYNQEPINVCEWIYNIKNTRLVLTNSFHGTIFAILFHKSFIVTPVEGSNMNDRITTLLYSLGLDYRIVEKLDVNKIDYLLKESIDWKQTDDHLKQLRLDSIEFLRSAIDS